MCTDRLVVISANACNTCAKRVRTQEGVQECLCVCVCASALAFVKRVFFISFVARAKKSGDIIYTLVLPGGA